MKKIYLLLCIPAYLISSCQKELDFDSALGPVGAGSTCSSGSYLPLATGNTWVFSQDGVTVTHTILPGDTTINGKVYKKLNQTGVAGQPDVIEYIREENGVTYDYINLGAAGVASGYVNRTLIKANAAVGDKWADTSIINGISEVNAEEMIEKGLSLTVGSQRYQNVIHIRAKVSLDFPPLFNNEVLSISEIYFSQCVGNIKGTTQMLAFGIPVSTMETVLVSSTLH